MGIGDEEGEECLASTSTTLSKNNWTHVAFVFNGTDTTPYINGVQGTRDNCGDVVDFGFVMGISSNDFLIGDGYDGVDFNGQLDEIMLFNKTLTQEEITEIYQVQNKDIIRFVHLTDTHIITGGSSNPIFMDGRTDTFGYFDEYPQYGIWNNTNNISTAPTRAFQDAVKLASAYFPLYVFHRGDISSSGGGLGGSHDTNCDGNLSSAQNLSRDILNNLTLVDKWYTVSANYHDAVTNESCLKIYTDAFGSDMVQWNFTNGNNIFVGLSELNYDVSNKYNITHINDTIQDYLSGTSNLFVFVHQPPNTYRATEDTQLINLLEDNTARFNTTQVYGGHGHSNDYSFNNSVHYIQTTAVMNYPTEFRIVDINGTASHAYNSTIINQNISDFSLFILNNAIISKAENTTLYGNESERNLMLNFQIASPVAALVTGETTSGTSFILRDSEANLSLSDLFDFSVSKRGKWFLEKENVLIVETYDYNLNFVDAETVEVKIVNSTGVSYSFRPLDKESLGKYRIGISISSNNKVKLIVLEIIVSKNGKSISKQMEVLLGNPSFFDSIFVKITTVVGGIISYLKESTLITLVAFILFALAVIGTFVFIIVLSNKLNK